MEVRILDGAKYHIRRRLLTHSTVMELVVVVLGVVYNDVGRAGLLGLVWYQAEGGLNLVYWTGVMVEGRG